MNRAICAAALLASLAAHAATAAAQQGVEVTPFGGYRFGNDFFELATGQPLDVDGAPAVGVAVDVPLWSSLQFEALFTHQHLHAFLPTVPYGPPVRWQLSVDHWQAGGLEELDYGPVRPFLVGALGLTRYGTSDDSEIRFTMSAGGGVKLFFSNHVGMRLGTQVFATFDDAGATGFVCAPGFCFVGLDTTVVWQIEFTAGMIFRFH